MLITKRGRKPEIKRQKRLSLKNRDKSVRLGPIVAGEATKTQGALLDQQKKII